MSGLIILCIIVGGSLCGIILLPEINTKRSLSLIGIFGGVLLTYGVMSFNKAFYPTPTALDVYQDKTTLEITFIDNIPVDSVVVFKKQNNHDTRR